MDFGTLIIIFFQTHTRTKVERTLNVFMCPVRSSDTLPRDEGWLIAGAHEWRFGPSNRNSLRNWLLDNSAKVSLDLHKHK